MKVSKTENWFKTGFQQYKKFLACQKKGSNIPNYKYI